MNFIFLDFCLDIKKWGRTRQSFMLLKPSSGKEGFLYWKKLLELLKKQIE